MKLIMIKNFAEMDILALIENIISIKIHCADFPSGSTSAVQCFVVKK